MPNTLASQLMELKRRAELVGRPLSQGEVAGLASGYFDKRAAQNIEGKQLALQELALKQNASQFADQLALRKADFAAQLSAADKARRMGWVNTGVGAGILAGLGYKLM